MSRNIIKIILLSFIVSLFVMPLQRADAAFFYPTKEHVGLNVHWTLGGFGLDNLYSKRLDESKTKWVREHFYTEVFYSDNTAWVYRYENKLKEYKKKGIKVGSHFKAHSAWGC